MSDFELWLRVTVLYTIYSIEETWAACREKIRRARRLLPD